MRGVRMMCGVLWAVAWACAQSPAPVYRTPVRADVIGIRHWSTSTYTRVVVDLDTHGANEDVPYEAARVEGPERIFFDLHHTRLSGALVAKSFTVTDDGYLTRIRTAQQSDDVTRIVLDVTDVSEYSAFLLPNPERLIIDIHGKTEKAGPRAQGPGPSEETTSSLPPMPVTDGSASFGVPQKPVPNTLMKPDTTGEVAAVGSRPGKVTATARPTTEPVAAKTAGVAKKTTAEETANVAGADHYVPRSARGQGSGARAQGEADEGSGPRAKGSESTGNSATLMRALGLKISRIVIDAGHGGHDTGTLGVDGIREKDVVLDVALRLGKLLHERLGAEIVYTRSDDTFIPLEARTAIANKAQADLFISVHANSSPEPSARGVEVYYLNFTEDADAMRLAERENAVSDRSVHELGDLVKKIALKDKIDESRTLAEDVDAGLFAGLTKGNAGLKDRGVKKAPFVVLIGANMPSVLAEISFVTNPDDAEQLATGVYRQRVAESLYAGVARYARAINGEAKPKVVKTAERSGGE